MKNNKELLIKREEPFCTITINRPEKRNALTPGCLKKMAKVFGELAEEESIRSVIIRGAGDKAFSSGYDINELPTKDSGKSLQEGVEKSPLDLAIASIRNFPYPVIAMLNGYAYGGGCELALACDIRIAADHARMGIPAAKRGLVYRYNGLRLLLPILGFSRTLEFLLTGRFYDSKQCLDMGLLNYAVSSDRLEGFTYEFAGEMAENAPLTLKGTKHILYNIVQYPILPETLIEEFNSLRIQSLCSEDVKEATKAFKEKRKPKFKGY